MATKPQLTDTQKALRKALDLAADSAVAYAAPEVPKLGNLTPEGLLEELGYMNEARKALEKTEKVLKERYKSLSKNAKTGRSDNFKQETADQERTALNQAAAKEYFEKEGILEDFMVTSSVSTMRISRL